MLTLKKIRNKKKKMLYFTFLILVAIAIKQPRAVLAADLVEDTFAAANSTLSNSTTGNCFFKPSKMVSAGLALTGLRTAFNPCEPLHKRLLSVGKVSCIVSGLTSGAIAESSCQNAKMHAVSSYVCWVSWSAHVALVGFEKRFN